MDNIPSHMPDFDVEVSWLSNLRLKFWRLPVHVQQLIHPGLPAGLDHPITYLVAIISIRGQYIGRLTLSPQLVSSQLGSGIEATLDCEKIGPDASGQNLLIPIRGLPSPILLAPVPETEMPDCRFTLTWQSTPKDRFQLTVANDPGSNPPMRLEIIHEMLDNFVREQWDLDGMFEDAPDMPRTYASLATAPGQRLYTLLFLMTVLTFYGFAPDYSKFKSLRYQADPCRPDTLRYVPQLEERTYWLSSDVATAEALGQTGFILQLGFKTPRLTAQSDRDESKDLAIYPTVPFKKNPVPIVTLGFRTEITPGYVTVYKSCSRMLRPS